MTDKDCQVDLFFKSCNALKVAITWAQAGQFTPLWNPGVIPGIRAELERAIGSDRMVEFLPRTLRANEVEVREKDEYSDLMGVLTLIFKELGRAVPDCQALLVEELGHLDPALRDPGLTSYTLGVVFAPVGEDKIDVCGFMRPVGTLNLETVVAMYRRAPRSSPCDHAMMTLFADLGL